jgi:hypothetical protein
VSGPWEPMRPDRSLRQRLASLPQRWSTLAEDLSNRGMVTVVAALTAGGLWLVSGGFERGAVVYGAIAEARDHRMSLAPLPYQTSLPLVHHVAGEDGMAGWLAVVRVDSISRPRDRRALCETVAAIQADPVPDRDLAVTWLTLSQALPGCLGPEQRRAVRDLSTMAGAAELRAELGQARWIVLDGSPAVIYSRPTVPSADAIRALARLAGAERAQRLSLNGGTP